jgi:hypothetical protein
MNGIQRRLLGLCLPPLLFCGFDMTLTLHGQPAQYWAGNYSQVNELSPTLGTWLRISPVAFVLGCTLLAALAVTIILLLPDALALIASIAGVMSGTYGASTWILYGTHWRYGYQCMAGLVLLAAILLGLAIRYGWNAQPAEEYRLPIPSFWRYFLAVILVAIVLYLSLRPSA